VRRRVLDEDAAVHHPRHAAQVVEVLGVHHRGVPEAVLHLLGEVDALVRARHPHQRHDRHHLLGHHQGMVAGDLGQHQAHLVAHRDADLLEQDRGVLADEGLVHGARPAGGGNLGEEDLRQLLDLGGIDLVAAVGDDRPLELVGDLCHREGLLLSSRVRAASASDAAPATVDPTPRRRCSPSWARIILEVYQVDPLVCARCGQRMSVLAFVSDQHSIRRSSTTSACPHRSRTSPRRLARSSASPKPARVGAVCPHQCGRAPVGWSATWLRFVRSAPGPQAPLARSPRRATRALIPA